MNNLKYIKDLVIKYKFRYLAGVLCLLIVDTLQLILPKVLGRMTDLLKTASLTKSGLMHFALAVAAIAIGIATFRFFWRYLVFGVSRIIEAELRNRFYNHLQKLSADYYNNHKTGDLMAHATNDINIIRIALGQGVAMAVDSAIIPIVAIIMMFNTVGAGLTLASFSPMAVLAVVIVFNVRFMQSRLQKMQEAFSDLTETARENFSGIRIVKSFVQEQIEMRKFMKANARNREMNLKFVRNTSFLFPLITAISSLSFAIALWYGGRLVISGSITLGDFVAFNSYLTMLVWPIAAVGWISNMFQRGSISLKRINKILDEEPGIKDHGNPCNITAVNGRLDIRNLNFTYPGSTVPVLRNINITVEAGKTMAVVGRTGSGKTTLANLVVRLFDVEDGTLLLDGSELNRVPLSLLRRSIGYVPQETFLFSSTIRENIDFFLGNDDRTLEEAAKTAGVYGDIMEFPDKFDTMVGERGVTLSGGQKQRIAIARALASDPAVLILDDCLSAVDTHTEDEILRGLKKVMAERTSIIISHRISTIKEADEIIVLEDGEIAERGRHESLLEKHGLYYELYEKQLLAEQIEGEE